MSILICDYTAYIFVSTCIWSEIIRQIIREMSSKGRRLLYSENKWRVHWCKFYNGEIGRGAKKILKKVHFLKFNYDVSGAKGREKTFNVKHLSEKDWEK